MRTLHLPGYRAFVSILVQARHDAGVSQQILAGRIGKPQSFVSKVERCERRLDVPEPIMIARALERDPAEFLRRVERAMASPADQP